MGGGADRLWNDIADQPNDAVDPRRRPSTSRPSGSSSTCGGRGRPLYDELIEAPYAPASPIATRIAPAERRQVVVTQRVRGLADRPVDAGAPEVRRRLAGDRPAKRGQRDDRVVRAVERRAQELGHARVEHHHRAAALTDMQDRRDDPSGPRDDGTGPAPRPTGSDADRRDAVDQRGQLAREPARRRHGTVVVADRNPPPTSSVSNDSSPPRSSPTIARLRRTASRQASTASELRPDVQVDAPWPQRGRLRR